MSTRTSEKLGKRPVFPKWPDAKLAEQSPAAACASRADAAHARLKHLVRAVRFVSKANMHEEMMRTLLQMALKEIGRIPK